MDRNLANFLKGGFGCLGMFLVVGLIFVLIGGTMHIDLCGAVMLFAIGGLLVMGIGWIYNKGKEDGRNN